MASLCFPGIAVDFRGIFFYNAADTPADSGVYNSVDAKNCTP